jgi:hypothetical protein
MQAQRFRPATLFELSTLGVLSVAAFTLLAVAAVELRPHAISPLKLEKIQAPLHAIACWKGRFKLRY